MSTENYQEMHIIPIGDSSVGKTSLANVFHHKQMPPPFNPGLCIDFIVKSITLDNQLLKLQVWDTLRQERFRLVHSGFYRRADGVMLVYDITERESFDSIKEYWYKEVCKHTNKQTPCILVGNKYDLENERAVDVSTAKEFADSLNIPFIETSAEKNINVEKAFVLMAVVILNKLTTTEAERNDNIVLAGRSIENESNKCYC